MIFINSETSNRSWIGITGFHGRDGQRSGPSCSHPSLVGRESLWGFSPDSSFLVWWVCDQPSRERLVSACPWYFFFNALMHWSRLDREACVFLCASAEDSTNFFTSDARPSQVSSLSNLLVGWRRVECDRKRSSLSFHLKRRDILSRSLGGSCLLLLYFVSLFDVRILNIALCVPRRGMYACVCRWAICIRPRGVWLSTGIDVRLRRASKMYMTVSVSIPRGYMHIDGVRF